MSSKTDEEYLRDDINWVISLSLHVKPRNLGPTRGDMNGVVKHAPQKRREQFDSAMVQRLAITLCP